MAIDRMRRIVWGVLLAISTAGASVEAGANPGPVSVGGAEVLTGQLACSGTVYTDGQVPRLTAVVYLSATSGLVSQFAPFPSEVVGVSASLPELGRICASYLERARAAVPTICALTATTLGQGEFANGASAHGSFNFVCEGRRDAIVRAIAAFSRAVVLADLR